MVMGGVSRGWWSDGTAGPAVCDRHPRLDQLLLRPFDLPGRDLQRGQGLMGIVLQQAEQPA